MIIFIRFQVIKFRIARCLFLGDAVNPNALRIAQFLQHAVSTMEIGPFGLDVDYRGTLGDDEADVLFFKKQWSVRRVGQFRSQLSSKQSYSGCI